MAEKKEKEEVSVSQKLAHKLTEKADWLRTVVIGVLVAAVVVIAVIAVVRRMDRTKRTASENALYLGQIEAFGSTDADPIAALDKVAKEYAGLPAGAQATLYKFGAVNGLNDAAQAETVAREFLKTYPNDPFAPQIRLALGQILFNAGRFEDARRELQPLAREGNPVYPEASLALAQIVEREAEAVKDDPVQYDRKLNEARDAYTTIASASQSRQSYWPPQVTQVAEFALLLINDRLAGYTHPAPKGAASAEAETDALDVGILAAPPPLDDEESVPAPADDQPEEAAQE